MALVVEQQSRGTRYIRVFGLLALMAGIVAMHALVLGMSHDGSHHRMDSPIAAVSTTDQHEGMSMPGCGGDCGNGHAGMHGCLFVLTGLLFLIGLAVLAWVGMGRRGTTSRKVRRTRANHARPPPWTVLSLAELAILRI
ncbi:DUF6153 family protein [Nocardia sp. CDC160]|uniref:DUF6153 family protein n=1 Tax=Nocardia sp. CDC160 TaxID=3112166 RepID=UPI002DBBEBE8|nr:DUF6153 family protein [Nocardia sp. CDC160]MEC3916866.1 DUF6153 family protein [Nocardia sp. CDC160]